MSGGRYRIIQFGSQLGVGVAGSTYAEISAVAKCNTGSVPYCIPNELICAEVARFLCLPVPPAGVILAPHTATPHWFASLDFNLTGNALPPVDPADCYARLPDLTTGVVLFDILVANPDRHRGNLSVDTSVAPARMNLFDHSHALFGSVAGQAMQRLQGLRDLLGLSGTPTEPNQHCLLDAITSDAHIGKWMGRIRQLPDFYIEEVCRSTVGLGASDAEVTAAIDFLRHRRDNIEQVVRNYRAEFQGISQWGLFP
jgi:hypothetical protein